MYASTLTLERLPQSQAPNSRVDVDVSLGAPRCHCGSHDSVSPSEVAEWSVGAGYPRKGFMLLAGCLVPVRQPPKTQRVIARELCRTAWPPPRTDPTPAAAGPAGRPSHLSMSLMANRFTANAPHMIRLHSKARSAPNRASQWPTCRLPKPAGGYRPIAMGEALRRWVGKVLLQPSTADLMRHYTPEQVGVGTPGGLMQ